MTVKELIIKLLEENMDAKVLVSIDKVHYNEHGRCEGYAFNIDSVNYEYGACMIKFKDRCGVLDETIDGDGRLSETSDLA